MPVSIFNQTLIELGKFARFSASNCSRLCTIVSILLTAKTGKSCSLKKPSSNKIGLVIPLERNARASSKRATPKQSTFCSKVDATNTTP